MRADAESRETRRKDRLSDREEARLSRRLDGKKERHPFKAASLSLLALVLIGITAGYYLFDVQNWQKLDISKITSVQLTGGIYASDGERIGVLRGTENRTLVSLASLPRHVSGAFIAAEDTRFYSHPGFDIARIFGAIRANLLSGGFSEGASTITQQLIKLSHLSAEKTVARKLEEVYLAVQLERARTKDEILEMYLNFIYFGRGAYGIQAAAQAYFQVDAKDLSVLQSAALAATVKAPSLYAPHLNEENNRIRRQYILNGMEKGGVITTAEKSEALGETLALVPLTEEKTAYGWYTDAALDEAESLLGLSAETLLGGGYHIYTALSREKQDIIDTQFLSSASFPADASDGEKAQSAMACVDAQTGAVLAAVGGREYTVRRGLNRATRLRRQPGSALKPLAVYAPALEAGYTNASVLNDSPTKFGSYSPRNSGNYYYGYVTFRTALAYSLNVAAVSLMSEIGVPRSLTYLKKVGIPLDANDGNLSLALGSMTYGVSPVQLAAAYAPFGNGGIYHEPYFIEKIIDAKGRVIYEHETKSARVLNERTAYLMTSLLQSVTSYGTGAKLSNAGTPVAGKTGTVNMTGGGNRDIWMAAYNPEISTAFWMGFDNPDSAHKLQSWVSGGDYTAAMAARFFKAAYAGKSKPSFSVPGGIVSLEIDRKSVEWAGEAMLAAGVTPSAYRYTEVFLRENHPTKESTVWQAPRAPSGFYVSHDNAGNPLLVITPADTALYRVQRDAVGECIILTELKGAAGTPVYYADTSAVPGVVYTYRVIPIHQELLNNGILLEGKQVYQIAQSRRAAARKTLENIGLWLTGR